MKLYELTESIKKVESVLDTDLDEDLKLEGYELLDQLEGNFKDKSLNIARLIKNFSSEIKIIKEEQDRLNRKKIALENKVNWLKEYLDFNFRQLGIDKVSDTILTLSMQKNPPSLEVVDEDKIPSKYKIPQPDKIDKRSALKDYKEQAIPGFELKQTKSIRIR